MNSIQICLFCCVNRYDIPIGLHANLSEGLPVCQKLTGSTLLNKDGFFHGKMGFREVLQSGQLKMSEVNRDTLICAKRHMKVYQGWHPYGSACYTSEMTN